MNYLIEHLDSLRREKQSLMEMIIPYWRRQVNGEDKEEYAPEGKKHGYAVEHLSKFHSELLELDNKITEVHNSLLKISAWDELFAEDFKLEELIDRAEGLGVNVERNHFGTSKGIYYFNGDIVSGDYTKFERGEWMY